jgi:hypothetical protein
MVCQLAGRLEPTGADWSRLEPTGGADAHGLRGSWSGTVRGRGPALWRRPGNSRPAGALGSGGGGGLVVERVGLIELVSEQ